MSTGAGEGRNGHAERAARTRLKIILAAERLFAERGIDSVSLREVAAAARQRNPAVVQYHFGSKEVLVEAILAHHRPPVNEARARMLDAITATEPEEVVRAAVEAIVLPLAQFLEREERSPFLRIFHLAQLREGARGLVLPEGDERGSVDPSAETGYRALDLIVRASPHLDRAEVELRLDLAMTMLVAALGRRDALERDARAGLPPRDRFLEELIEGIVAMLLRPSSASRSPAGRRRRQGRRPSTGSSTTVD